jgi:outer membrane receptor protein involved in Fe transport
MGQVPSARAERVRFDIPAGPADTTLRKFADQSNMNVLFQSDEVNTQITKAVRGNHEPVEALKLMLEGSGLQIQFQGPDSVLVSATERDLSSGQSESSASVTVYGGPETYVKTSFETGHLVIVRPSLTLTRSDFESGGFQTIGDVLRSLPQNFGGGLNIGLVFAGGTQNKTSVSGASTMNLRGLGSESTLVLVNGQRLAAAEASGAADISLIPLSAVDRIEITMGGAAAQYGSDAVAGVVNIITRTDLQGVELSSAASAAIEGGGFLRHHSVVAGHAVGDANVFSVVDCVRQHEIDAQERDYIPAALVGTTLMPRLRYCSTLFSASDSFPGGLEASVLGAFTKRSVYEAENLALLSGNSAAITSTQSDVDEYSVNAIIKRRLSQNWEVTLSTGLSVDDATSPERLMRDGAPIQQEGDRFDNRLWSGQVIASGPLVETRAGAAHLAIGAGYSQQGFQYAALHGGEFAIAKERHERFAFAESTLPLVPSSRGAKDPSALSLDVALRTDRYSDVGATTNSKVVLAYKPTSSVKVEASWGTSFRAPTLLQQYDIPQALLEFVPDALSPVGRSLALLRLGGNALLKPEASTDAALNLTFTPEALSGASVQVSYYTIFYRKRIEYPTLDTTDPLLDPNIQPFVIHNPSSGSISEILAQSQFIDFTAGSNAQQAALVIDDRNQNVARQRASGVDLLGKYSCDTRFGKLEASLNTAYLDLKQQIFNDTALIPVSGTLFYPPVWRGRFGVNWSDNRYMGSLFVNYTGGSREVGLPGEPIASWTTLDGRIAMKFPGGSHWGSTTLSLSALNMLDRHPPLFKLSESGGVGINYDSTNTSSVGQFLTLQLTTQAW